MSEHLPNQNETGAGSASENASLPAWALDTKVTDAVLYYFQDSFVNGAAPFTPEGVPENTTDAEMARVLLTTTAPDTLTARGIDLKRLQDVAESK